MVPPLMNKGYGTRFNDCVPVFLIMGYNAWPVLTKNFFALLFCKLFPDPASPGLSTSQDRLMMNPDVTESARACSY